MEKLLILKDESVDWERFYSIYMKRSRIDVERIYKTNGALSDFICHVFMHFDLPGYSIFFEKWKKKLKNYTTIIIFDRLYSQNIIKFIHKTNPQARIVFWYWNLIEDDSKKPQYRNLAEYWTFDAGDEKKYNLMKNHQFYFNNIENQLEMKESDIFFVGADKGRYKKLKTLQSKLKSKGYKTKFFIIKDKTSEESGEYAEFMSYEEVMKYIKGTKCIVDYYQEKQTGLTLRTLEAIFFNKKVVTNNKEIKKYSFYKPDRFLIIPEEMNQIDSFINDDISDYTKKEQFQFSYESWLECFNIDWRDME